MNALTTGALRRLHFTLAAIFAFAFALAAPAAPAAAQDSSKIVNFPAEKFNIAPGGVDMRTGRFVYSETDLSIGGEQGGLALTRTMVERVANHANPFGNFSHNWDIFLLETRTDLYSGNRVGNDYRMNLHGGGRSFTFEGFASSPGYAYKSDGPPAILTFSGGDKASASVVYTVKGPDGTIMTFRPMGGGDCADEAWGTAPRRCAFISEMIEPDGTRYSFAYAQTSAGDLGNFARLRQVISSRGYALLLEGSGSSVTKACVLNLALAGVPADGLCPAGALATAHYDYEPGGRLAKATSPGGAESGFTYSAGPNQNGAMGFVKPGQNQPWLTNGVGFSLDEEDAVQEIVGSQVFADGQTYGYGFARGPYTTNRPNPAIAGGSYTDADDRTTWVNYAFPLMPGSGPTTVCVPHPCELDQPDDYVNYVYQQTPGPVEIIDPLGRRTVMDYCDPLKLASPPPYDGCAVYPLQWFTDPEGIRTVLEYDGMRNVTKATRYPKPGVPNPDGSTPAPVVSEAAYDLANPKAATKPLWIKDGNGNVTRWAWSSETGGVLAEMGAAVNGVTPHKRYTYEWRYARFSNGDGTGSPIAVLIRMAFCRTGNPDPSGTGCALGADDEIVTDYDYGPHLGPTNLQLRGQAVTANEATLRTCYAYDGLGRRISETSPMGTAGLAACPLTPPTSGLPYTISTRYDPDGRVTGTIAPDPDGAGGNGAPAVRNSYDPAGRLTKVEQGALAAWQSEAVAPASWSGFTIHKAIDTEYDALDRKTREWVSGDGTIASITEYSYDLSGRLLCTAVRMNPDVWTARLLDKCVPGPAHAVFGADRISRNVYDPAGQLVEVWDGVGTPLARREALYEYNGNGQKTSLTDARGFRAEMTWDGLGRQSRWIFPSRTTPGVADSADQEYYLYDPAGNRTKLRKRDGSILTFQYDALNRMTAKFVPVSASGAAGYSVHSGYDNRGLQTYARFGSASGAGVTNAWDGFGRLAGSTTTMGGTGRKLSYQLDSNGNRLALQGDAGYSGYYAGFAYDGLDRMTAYVGAARIGYDSAGRRSSLGLGWGGNMSTVGYGYDWVGRLASLGHNLAGTAADLTLGFTLYNPASQLVTRTGSNDLYAWTGANAVSRTYAANGLNQYTGTIVDGAPGATFAYDDNGNLISDGSTGFVYDAENRLVSASGARNAALAYDPLGRLWRVTGASGTTEFVYDGDRLLLEYDGGGGLLRAYIHGPGADEPVAWNEIAGGAGFRFLHADHQGSIVAVTDGAGNAFAINSYDEYGIPGADNQGRFGYTGQTWIPELGLWYYKARFYSSRLGRFLQTDPIGYDGGVNLYGYVENDPINQTDPTGLCNPAASRICAERERQFKAARAEGVRKAWAAEKKLVAAGGGTRPWTRAERAELLSTGKVKGYQGHHINTVKGNPIDLARDPNNVRFVTPAEHVKIHREAGGYRNPITGKPLVGRFFGVFGGLSIFTGTLSGRIRTNNLDNFVSDIFGYDSLEDTIKMETAFCRGVEYKGVPCA